MDDNTETEGFLTRLQNWAIYPFQNQMDMLDVLLTVVLVATLAFAWIMVLRHLVGDGE